MICAGSPRSGDSCSGDSGGPLLCRRQEALNASSTAAADDEPRPYVVYGIISFGEGCEERGQLGVYTRVSRFIAWINAEMQNSVQTAPSGLTSLPLDSGR